MLISFAVTAKLICIFVFAYAKRCFSHDAAHMYIAQNYISGNCILSSLCNDVMFSFTSNQITGSAPEMLEPTDPLVTMVTHCSLELSEHKY